MVLKLEQILGSKNCIALLRFLLSRPSANYGLTELSEITAISKSNLLRILRPLRQEKLVLEQKQGKKKLWQVNGEHQAVQQLWKLYMLERKLSLPAGLKNVIDLFFHQVQEKVTVFIVFGSVAQGLATKESDIDILVVGEKTLQGPWLKYLPYRLELHNYTFTELQEKKDFVVLEALTNGIAYKGEIFPLLKELKSFPKAYLLFRLQKVKEFLVKAAQSKGEIKRYYLELARVSCGELDALLRTKKLITKRKIKIVPTPAKIQYLEKAIAQEGDSIWLI